MANNFVPLCSPAKSLEEGATRIKETQVRLKEAHAALVSAKEILTKAMVEYENAEVIDREAQSSLLMLVRQDA